LTWHRIGPHTDYPVKNRKAKAQSCLVILQVKGKLPKVGGNITFYHFGHTANKSYISLKRMLTVQAA